ncbi:hypothetical protein, partial [Helicobacter sp. T3_23-1059]
LHILTKNSLALKSDENLTINVNDFYAKSKNEVNLYVGDCINLYVSSDSSIELSKDKIILKVKDSELTLDENGLTVNKPVNVKKR